MNIISYPETGDNNIPYIKPVANPEMPIPRTKEQTNEIFDKTFNEKIANTLNHRIFEFEFWTLKNELFTKKDIENKVSIFNFYYINCSAGSDDIETRLPKLISKYKDNDSVKIICVFMGASQKEGIKGLHKFGLEKERSVYFIALKKSLYSKFNADFSPSRIVVDQYGIVKHYSLGLLNDEELSDIDSLVQDNFDSINI